jgi:hypothetical protein
VDAWVRLDGGGFNRTMGTVKVRRGGVAGVADLAEQLRIDEGGRSSSLRAVSGHA